VPTNNVTRFLDSRKINFAALELSPAKRGAEETARLLEVDPSRVYKTIVVERKTPGKTILAVVPGDSEVDLKALAQAVGEKKVTAASLRTAEQLTGLQAGGISPLALINRGFEIVIDAQADSQEDVYISGGERRISIRLPGLQLIRLTGGKTAEISL